jgi:hypothetical protein
VCARRGSSGGSGQSVLGGVRGVRYGILLAPSTDTSLASPRRTTAFWRSWCRGSSSGRSGRCRSVSHPSEELLLGLHIVEIEAAIRVVAR